MQRVRFALPSLVCALAISACKDDGSGSSGSRELEFSGEQTFLPGFDFDSGWLPEASPVAVRATVTAGGGITVAANATSDGETLTPVAGSGVLSVEGSLALEISARIDTNGLMYDDVVASFDYGIEAASQTFEPFAIDGNVMVTSTLPAAELGRVPIGTLPGTTLVLSIEGGEIATAFAGTCADAKDGFGQYTGAITTQGTVAAAATVEIEIPLLDPLTFGPFAIDIPIPASESPVDLGTFSLDTGEPADGTSVCSGGPTSATGDDGPTSGNDSVADDAPATGSDDAVDSGGDDEDTGATGESDGTGDGSGDDGTTGSMAGDPDYPPIEDNTCPAGYAGVEVNSEPANGVCLPPCGGDGSCPAGATGSAVGDCAVNPDSTYAPCMDSSECGGAEFCDQNFCIAPPSHCALGCDDVSICPDAMICLLDVCTYPQ